MAVTPNYGWPVPVDTDYVKDGWEAISDLGNAIDTTVAGLGSGLNLIETKSFTTQSAVQFDNCFTSTYTNYRAIISLSAVSVTGGINIRFVDGTSPITTQNYAWAWQGWQINGTGTANASGTSGLTYGQIAEGNSSEGDRVGSSVDFYAPQLAQPTSFSFTNFGRSTNNSYSGIGGGCFVLSTQFEGIQFLPASGTISGRISIYGYKK